MKGDNLYARFQVWAGLVLLVTTFSGVPAQADDEPWSVGFTTHARTYAMAGHTTLEASNAGETQATSLYVVIQRVRPALDIWWDDFVGVELAYDLAPMFSSSLGAASLSEFALSSSRSLRLVDFDPDLFEPGEGDWRLRHNLDRLNIRLGQPGMEVQIGRQAINHGSARMFPATDFYAPFGPGTIDSEFKQGIDAIRFTGAIGEYHEIEMYVVAHEPTLDDGLELDSWMYLGRWRATFPEILDMSILGGFSYGRPTLGLDISADVLGAAVYGEASTRLKIQEGQEASLRATLGLDYYWNSGFQALVELHYSSPGSRNAEDTLVEPSTEHQVGEVNLLGQWYMGVSASYMWQLFNFGAGAILNVEDASALFTLSAGYEIVESVSLGFGAMVPFGNGPRLEADALGESSMIRFDDEFGIFPLLGYFDLRAAF